MTLPKPSPESVAQSVANMIGRPDTAKADGATLTIYTNNAATAGEQFVVYPFTATFQEATE